MPGGMRSFCRAVGCEPPGPAIHGHTEVVGDEQVEPAEQRGAGRNGAVVVRMGRCMPVTPPCLTQRTIVVEQKHEELLLQAKQF